MSVLPAENKLDLTFHEARRIHQSNAYADSLSNPEKHDVVGVHDEYAIGHAQPSSVSPRSSSTGVTPSDQRLPHRDAFAVKSEVELLAGDVTPDHADEEDEYLNRWATIRRRLRVYFAEFLGTLILVLWGEGTQAQVLAARKTPDDYLSISWGWGIGFMFAIYVSSGISGGHINPAVTISLALFRGFSWKRVPGYIFAQLLGGFTAAAILYGVYYGPLHDLQGGYASVLTTGPSGLLPSLGATFFSVFVGAALLLGAIAAFSDTGNNATTPGLTPLLLGLVMVGQASAFGYQTGFVLNPARDLGPRLLVWATGGGGSELWLANEGYGIWIPTVGSIAGGIFGILMYDILIYRGRDSPVNWNFSRKNRRVQRRRRADDIENSSSSTVVHQQQRA